MAATPSNMLALGTPMPEFELPDFNGSTVKSTAFSSASAILVVFLCPHCPFVRHTRTEIGRLARDYQPRGLVVFGINPNDTTAFPQDGPDGMKEEAKIAGYPFPYLQDESQDVAKLYHAACTPDFFLFDRDRKLVYRGQLDSSRPGNNIPVTGTDLRAALDAVLTGNSPSALQKPSIGCSIKWKPGNAPESF